MNKKNIFIGTIVAILAVFIVQLDVRDAFTHGYFTDSPKYDQIYEGDIQGYVDLEKESYSVTFSPIKDHFAGFVLYFADQPENNSGTIELTVTDESGKTIDTIQVDLSKVKNLDDYKVYANQVLKKGKIYTVEITALACTTVPKMVLVDRDYITDECYDNNLLLGYAYKKSTFTSSEKLLITILVITFTMILISLIEKKEKAFKKVYFVGMLGLLSAIMAWHFSFNSIDNENTTFVDYDKGSESIVTSTIKAEQVDSYAFIHAGLNTFTDITGSWNAYDKSFLTDSDWTRGYGNTQSQIRLRTSKYVTDFAAVDNYMKFANGDKYQITDVSSDDTWTIVTVNSQRPLNPWKYGDLSEASFLDTQGNEVVKGYSQGYESHFGLQGKVFRHLARHLEVDLLRTFCALAASIVFVWISYLAAKKYNSIFGSVFYFVFLLSPWVLSFAKNLYWVEFTWFLPMAAGLICALKVENRKYRIFSYIFAFGAVAVKCLCGYEYISAVMMGMITFLLADFIVALLGKNKDAARLLFRTIFIIGLAALLGFAVAICIHAPEKTGSNGNILKGIKLIIQNDVLRRTYGADINIFDEWAGPEGYAGLASVWEVFRTYFHFSTDVITGVDSNMFAFVCIIPVLIFIYDFKNKQTDKKMVALYGISFLTSISWFVLAKSHSYVHSHLNYVLWYFGYIQICFYVIVSRIWSFIKAANLKGVK